MNITKYFLEIIDEDGGVHPVRKGEWSEIQVYSVPDESFSQYTLGQLKMFDSPDEAREFIRTCDDFQKRNVAGNSTYPPSALHNGLRMNNARPVSQGKFRLRKLELSTVDEWATETFSISRHEYREQ